MGEEDIKEMSTFMKSLFVSNHDIQEHCEVEWLLADMFCVKIRSARIFSPEFSLTRGESLWCLYTDIDFQEDVISIYLRREVKNIGPENILIRHRFGILFNNFIDWGEERARIFKTSNVASSSFEDVKKYIDKDRDITIYCEIMVLTPSSQEIDSLELCSAFDSYNILINEYLSDLTLCAKDGVEIKAHKLILAEKSPYFVNMILEDETLSVLDLSTFDAADVRSMLLYMYTGHYDIWLRLCYINFKLCDLIDKFEVVDLINIMEPSDILILQCNEYKGNFVWTINDFDDFMNFPDVCPDFHFKLFFGFKITVEYVRNTFNFIIEPFDEVEEFVGMEVWVRLCLLDRDLKEHNIRETKLSIGEGDIFLVATIAKDYIYNPELSLITDNAVKLSGEIKIVNTAEEESKMQITRNYPTEMGSKHFSSIYKTELFKDFTIFVDDKEFPAHKAILGGRSLFFNRIFEDPLVDCGTIKDLSPESMESLLSYIYTGQLNVNLDTAVELYKRSEKYGVTALEYQLVVFFTSECPPEKACELAMTAWEKRQRGLEKLFPHLIMYNFEDIGLTDEWYNLVQSNEELARTILHLLAEFFKSSLD